MTRSQFLKSASAALAAASIAPLTATLHGCAPSALALHAPVVDDTVRIPLTDLPALHQPNIYVKVYVDQLPNPFILFAQHDDELWAVLSTCSHRGCEVKKLRTKFECPCHGSEYDLDGNVTRGPAPSPLERFKVKRVGNNVEFSL